LNRFFRPNDATGYFIYAIVTSVVNKASLTPFETLAYLPMDLWTIPYGPDQALWDVGESHGQQKSR
jgi:hypothetical protein